MAETTNIDYADSTWSPWIGCDKCDQHGKIREGCRHCYAEIWSRRNPRFRGHWGKHAPRYFFGDEHWQQPLRWQRKCERLGKRKRVLVSLCDPFEELPHGHQQRRTMHEARCSLWRTIGCTPHLTWLVLTKRPENMTTTYLPVELLPNLWLGVSVWDQSSADRNIPLLLEVPAALHWVSLEPLLGPVELELGCDACIKWVVVGCESRGARPGRRCDWRWVESLAKQCKAADVPMFAKQLPSLGENKLVKSAKLALEGWPVEMPRRSS